MRKDQIQSLLSSFAHQMSLAREQDEAIFFVIKLNGDLKGIEWRINDLEETLERSKDHDKKLDNLKQIELLEVYLMGLRSAHELIRKELTNNQVYSEKITVLLHKLSIPLGAKADAFEFALENGGNIEIIATRIKELEERTFNPPKDREKAMHPGATPGMYNRAFINTLKEIMNMISDENLNS
jgi:hypothetical protein